MLLSHCTMLMFCVKILHQQLQKHLFLNFIFELLMRGVLTQRVTAFGAKTKTHHDLLVFFLVFVFFLPGTLCQAGFH